jgi:hypothetical protein
MHKGNIKTRSRNHCCRGKLINIRDFECVSISLVTQHATRMHHTVICTLTGCIILFDIMS